MTQDAPDTDLVILTIHELDGEILASLDCVQGIDKEQAISMLYATLDSMAEAE